MRQPGAELHAFKGGNETHWPLPVLLPVLPLALDGDLGARRELELRLDVRDSLRFGARSAPPPPLGLEPTIWVPLAGRLGGRSPRWRLPPPWRWKSLPSRGIPCKGCAVVAATFATSLRLSPSSAALAALLLGSSAMGSFFAGAILLAFFARAALRASRSSSCKSKSSRPGSRGAGTISAPATSSSRAAHAAASPLVHLSSVLQLSCAADRRLLAGTAASPLLGDGPAFDSLLGASVAGAGLPAVVGGASSMGSTRGGARLLLPPLTRSELRPMPSSRSRKRSSGCSPPPLGAPAASRLGAPRPPPEDCVDSTAIEVVRRHPARLGAAPPHTSPRENGWGADRLADPLAAAPPLP